MRGVTSRRPLRPAGCAGGKGESNRSEGEEGARRGRLEAVGGGAGRGCEGVVRRSEAKPVGCTGPVLAHGVLMGFGAVGVAV